MKKGPTILTGKAQETRRRSLRKLSTDFDGITNLAKALGFKGPSYVSQMMRGHREISEKTAAFIETKLRLSKGWMDQEHRGETISNHEMRTIDAVLQGVLQAVEESGKDMPNSKFVEIIKLSSRHIRESGRLDHEFLQDLVRLASR